MSFASLKETIYQTDGPDQVVLISPHGADGKTFLAASGYPGIAPTAGHLAVI